MKLLWPRTQPRQWTDDRVSQYVADMPRWVDGSRALVCATCQCVHEPQGACVCPRCGSRESWSLALVLNRGAA